MDQLPQAILDGLVLSSIYAIVALGLTLIFGVLQVVNFSHGQLVTLAAYVAFALVNAQVNFWLALVIVLVAMSALGVFMEWATFRPVQSVPINGLIVSIGWIAIFTALISVIWGPNQYSMNGIFSGSITTPTISISQNHVFVVVCGLVVMAAISLTLRFTPIGKAIRATAQNREAAALVGIRVRRISSVAFGLSAALAGLGGILLANLFPVSPGLGQSYMVYAFIALVIGGAGSAVGAVLGSVVIGMVIAFAQTYGSITVVSTLPFVVLIVVLFLRPRGLIRTDIEASL